MNVEYYHQVQGTVLGPIGCSTEMKTIVFPSGAYNRVALEILHGKL